MRLVTLSFLLLLLALVDTLQQAAPSAATGSSLATSGRALEEFIQLEADSLEPSEVVRPGYWKAKSGPSRESLEDGSVLLIDRHTRAGRYVLEQGQVLELGSATRGGRSLTWIPKPTRNLYFRTVTARRAEVVVRLQPDTSFNVDAGLVPAGFDEQAPWLGSVPPASESTGLYAAAIARSWYPRGYVRLPDPRRQWARITWLTFAANLELRPRALLNAESRQALADSAGNSAVASESRPTTSEPTTVHVLGSVLVDLATGRVVRRSGAVY